MGEFLHMIQALSTSPDLHNLGGGAQIGHMPQLIGGGAKTAVILHNLGGGAQISII